MLDLVKRKRDSEEDTRRRVEKANAEDAKNFNARTDGSLTVMPYQDDNMIFRQQDRRVSWMYAGDKYCSARHYPNAECAKAIIDELARLGAKNAEKED